MWKRLSIPEGEEVTTAAAVQKAISRQIYRSARLRDRYQDEIIRKTIFIDTDGRRVGQVNGLSVVMLGNSNFCHPTRITARVRIGNGEVINIEREVEMSGPIHSRGGTDTLGFFGCTLCV